MHTPYAIKDLSPYGLQRVDTKYFLSFRRKNKKALEIQGLQRNSLYNHDEGVYVIRNLLRYGIRP